MHYDITQIISIKEINRLRCLLNANNTKLYTDSLGDVALGVKLLNGTNEAYIENTTTLQSDGDLYPKIEIRENLEPQKKWDCLINQKLGAIRLIRDNVSWQNGSNTWKLHYDVGLKLIFSTEEVHVFAVDSLAGFLKCFIPSREKLLDINKELNEYWCMKTDTLINSARVEIDISTI